MNYEKYIKIPMKLLLDKNITANAKLFFGLLLVRSIKEGYCYADNNYLSNILNLGNRTITRLLKELSDNNYIILKYKYRFIRSVYINDNVSNI